MKKILVLLALTLSSQFAFSQKNGSLILDFKHLFDGEEIDFSNSYQNIHGEDVKFTTINYFISNIALKKKDGSYYVLPQDSSYFVIRQDPNTDKRTVFINNLPVGKYESIRFTVGVDSLRNTMSIEHRTGSLDVGDAAKGMYWIWNSGYIFFKLEGTSSSSTEKMKNRFTYHIGGFGGYKTKTINSLRETELIVKTLNISPKRKQKIEIKVNLDKFFHGHYDLKISDKPNVMWGEESEKIADNYIKAFEIE